ncbi:MAG: hypothetical protein ACKVI4_14655 [Actinomycetales bacterium]
MGTVASKMRQVTVGDETGFVYQPDPQNKSFGVSEDLSEKVLGETAELDVLPEILRRIRDHDLALFLDVLSRVSKPWKNVCRQLDSPDKRLRDEWKRYIGAVRITDQKHLDFLGFAMPHSDRLRGVELDCLWLTEARLERGKQMFNIPHTVRTVLLNGGGWVGREARRRAGFHLRVGTVTYSPPPTTVLKGQSHKIYDMHKDEVRKIIKYERLGESRKKDWIKMWKEHDTHWKYGVVVLIGMNEEGVQVSTYYAEVKCKDDATVHPQLLRLTPEYAKAVMEKMQQMGVLTPGMRCTEENDAISPSRSGWEVLYF